jgi:hypothetical protein
MPSPFAVVGIVAGVLGLALGAAVWQLNVAWTNSGKYQQALDTCTTRLKELNDAHKERDQIDGQNRALPDDKLFGGLLR